MVLVQSPSSQSQATANNGFALALFAQLHRQSGNLCCSPFSIRAALAMAYAGAQGETARQMEKSLGLLPGENALHPDQQALYKRLTATADGYEMAIANSLWTQDGVPLQAAFRDGLTVNFRLAADQARATINQWVEDHTKGRITDLIPLGGVRADTRLVIANAVYFKGKWVSPFEPEDTCDEPFYLAGGKTARARLMYQPGVVRYVEAPEYQAVQLDYEGSDLAMLVLLPNRRDGLQGLEDRLSVALLEDCDARAALRPIRLYLPRFKTTWAAVDLQSALAALGMSLPFDASRADFSGINGLVPPDPEALFIGAVFHKAFAEVNEEGTEAAAATTAMLLAGSALDIRPQHSVPVFRADHPFLYVIRDRTSGVILFLGRVNDPTRED